MITIKNQCLPYTLQEIVPSNQSQLEKIGRFRLEVWEQETAVNKTLFSQGIWLDALDPIARHWIVTDDSDKIVATARLTLHQTLAENPDGYLWINAHRALPEPVGNLSKLVVSSNARGQGLGKMLNEIRIKALNEMGGRSIIVTASKQNVRLLCSLGFVDTGIRVTFPNRPDIEFLGLEYLFTPQHCQEQAFPCRSNSQ